MKNCKSFRKLISRYVDNDLIDEEKQFLIGHLSSCLECMDVLNDYSMMRNDIRESCALPVREKVMISLKHPDRRWSFFPSLLFNPGVCFAAIGIAVIVLFGGVLLHTGPNSPAPIVMGNESAGVMNTPLGAMVYYEEFAGTMVSGQFTRLQTNRSGQEDRSESVALTNAIGYESPLFHDNSLIQQRYEMANNYSK
jgi:hypothetical protein